MGLLHDKLLRQQQVITAEIAPPKGAGTKRLKEKINLLKPFVTAINITDGQRALVRMASWAACKVVQELGVEPVLQMTCRDRNTGMLSR
ncbi:MAG: hypothetical protein EB078_11055 [Proteobacteria bacterium]|nr:hypothetical protein [Pseudomonadota bacterium]NDD05436.1 hypothetical protein [Pseudomonadota bacterium]NDG27693.1 hypothetical protein [Pseudomonadota bacterium]